MLGFARMAAQSSNQVRTDDDSLEIEIKKQLASTRQVLDDAEALIQRIESIPPDLTEEAKLYKRFLELEESKTQHCVCTIL